MYPSTLSLTVLLFTTANLLTSYLYLYPLIHLCGFPAPPVQTHENIPLRPSLAPFRLLLLGDPQLEGSSSLLDPSYAPFPSVRAFIPSIRASPTFQTRLHVTQQHLQSLLRDDIPIALRSWRKQLDLLGNDYYLAHIYRSLQWFTNPSHTAVLGDLLGSQWIDDDEFEARARRYWNRVFSGGEKVGEKITYASRGVGRTQPLGVQEVGEQWQKYVINVAGNHDVGYAGDVTRQRVARFEKVFGKVNWEIGFTLPVRGAEWEGRPPPELRLVVLNSLNLDGPVTDVEMQAATMEFLDGLAETARPVEDATSATILLTHLPLHKEEGVCVDGPLIRYAMEHEGGGVREQNHLSYESSAGLLDSIFGLSAKSSVQVGEKRSNGMILTGHDHEGCNIYHYLPTEDESGSQRWAAEQWNASSATRHASAPGIREVTVRSMMGEFGGNAGLLSAWFDPEEEKWDFDYTSCALGKQHLWWAIHVLDIVAVVMCLFTGMKLFRESFKGEEVTAEKKTQ